MARVLSGYNPERLAEVVNTWHLRDALLAYEDHVRQIALVEYRHAVLVYSVLAPYAQKGKLKPPRKPRILGG